jgi:hypothetical protein
VTEVSYALGALCSLGLSWAVLSQSAGVFKLPMYVNDLVKEELYSMYFNVSSFYKASF